MTYRGQVLNGQIKLEDAPRLPEGTKVNVEVIERNGDGAARRETTEKWLTSARGAARTGMTTDQIMALTRGEA